MLEVSGQVPTYVAMQVVWVQFLIIFNHSYDLLFARNARMLENLKTFSFCITYASRVKLKLCRYQNFRVNIYL